MPKPEKIDYTKTGKIDYEEIIANLPYNQDTRKAVAELIPEFKKLENSSCRDLNIIRNKLGDYNFRLPNNKKSIAQACTVIVKFLQARAGTKVSRNVFDGEVLSDHAMRRVLERVHGIDIVKLKEALEKTITKKYERVYVENKIVTIRELI